MPKNSIRRDLLRCRDTLTPANVALLSDLITARLTVHAAFVAAKTVALYRSVRTEVSTANLHEAARAAGKRVTYPRMLGDTLEFVIVDDPATMSAGRYGIFEPATGAVLPVKDMDLIVLPGVAFDRRGIRLGYGKGCYDRALADQDWPTLVGLAYDFQLVETLPAESYDIPVDIIVTEKETLHL